MGWWVLKPSKSSHNLPFWLWSTAKGRRSTRIQSMQWLEGLVSPPTLLRPLSPSLFPQLTNWYSIPVYSFYLLKVSSSVGIDRWEGGINWYSLLLKFVYLPEESKNVGIDRLVKDGLVSPQAFQLLSCLAFLVSINCYVEAVIEPQCQPMTRRPAEYSNLLKPSFSISLSLINQLIRLLLY